MKTSLPSCARSATAWTASRNPLRRQHQLLHRQQSLRRALPRNQQQQRCYAAGNRIRGLAPSEAGSAADTPTRSLLPEPEFLAPLMQESADGAPTETAKSEAGSAAADVTEPVAQTADNAQTDLTQISLSTEAGLRRSLAASGAIRAPSASAAPSAPRATTSSCSHRNRCRGGRRGGEAPGSGGNRCSSVIARSPALPP